MGKRCLGLLVGLFLAVACHAANIAVLPVGLAFAPGHDRAAITVSNQDKESVVVQVETVAWRQADGQDVYVPTDALLVNPAIFRIQPGRSQVLRIGLRRPPAGDHEEAYRLILREVPSTPPASDAGAGQVRVLLQIRLPVYVAPALVVPGEQWQGRWTGDGGLEVSLANTGNVHMVVGELKLRAADAAPDALPLASLKVSTPVFPGQSRTWRLRPPAAARGHRYMLEVTTDRGPHDVALDPGRP